MKEFDVDRALGGTPPGFTVGIQAALSACHDAPLPHRRRIPFALAFALGVLLAAGTAFAVVTAVGGLEWFMTDSLSYWPQYYPETYRRVLNNLQKNIPQENQSGLVDVRAEDAAWLEGELFLLTLQAEPQEPTAYEMYDEMAFIADGEGEFRLSTEKGYDHPRLTMRDPEKQLILLAIGDLAIGAPDGPALMPHCYHCVTTSDGKVLWYIEVDLTEADPGAMEKKYAEFFDGLSSAEREEEKAAFDRGESVWSWRMRQAQATRDAILAAVSPEGVLTLYLPYTLDYLSWDKDEPDNSRVEWNQPGGMLKIEIQIR